MISPYKGTFRVSQAYRNLRANGTYHHGYDLVGIGDKSIYCPVYGTVIRAGWECATLPKKGFGQRAQQLRKCQIYGTDYCCAKQVYEKDCFVGFVVFDEFL